MDEELQAINEEVRCSHCDKNKALESHTCPYAKEINDDYTSLCDCCEECIYECCMDI